MRDLRRTNPLYGYQGATSNPETEKARHVHSFEPDNHVCYFQLRQESVKVAFPSTVHV